MEDPFEGQNFELKNRILEIESENDLLTAKLVKARQSILRLRLERKILFEKLQGIHKSADNVTVSDANVSGFAAFANANRVIFQNQNPHLPSDEIGKLLSKAWAKLNETQKQNFNPDASQ